MKILYIHQYFSTPNGSTGIRSYRNCLELIARGHEVTVLCGSYSTANTGLTEKFHNRKRTGIIDGIRVIELSLMYSNKDSYLKRSWTFFRFLQLGFSTLMKEDYDVIVATSTPLTVGLFGLLGKWLRGKPFIFEVRDQWPKLPKAMGVIKNPFLLTGMRIIEKFCYKYSSQIIALAPGIVNGIKDCNVKEDKIHMIPNGCDIENFEINLYQNKNSVKGLKAVYAGTFGTANGLDGIIEVAKVLQNKNRSDIELELIGEGAQRNSLINQINTHSLENIKVSPPMDKNTLIQYLHQADVGLQTLMNVEEFYDGTSPNKFFDYISVGLPVICNYPGWITDLIKQYNCGYYVTPDSPIEFSEILERAADDRERLSEMGRNSRTLAVNRFDRKSLTLQFAEVVESVKWNQ